MSRTSLANDIWRACDIMRRDDGTTGIMEYMEQLSWLLFLKAFEDIEDHYEETTHNLNYIRVIGGPYRWSVWAGNRRKQAEVVAAEAQQLANKCDSALGRARERLESLKLGKDQGIKNGKILKPSMFDTEKTADAEQQIKIIEAEQQLKIAEASMNEAQASLEGAKENLAITIIWLEDQVKLLYEDQAIEQRVLQVIQRQFNGQLVLEPDQLNRLRQTERQQGLNLAHKLVSGLNDIDLMDFVDRQLFPFLRQLQGTPQQNTISSIFKELPGNRIRSATNFKAVIDLIDKISFKSQEDTQIVSQVYEDLLSRLGTESGIAGEFYTPRHIIRFIINIINPLIGEKIYDPFCGSAGFLVEAYKYMKAQELTKEDHDILQYFTYYGQEKKPLPALIGTMNMIMHGVLTPNISRVNTLEKEDIRTLSPEKGYSVILTNPPFGGKEGPHIQRNFPIQSGITEILALEYIIAKLHSNGRCGVVIPESILFRSDDACVNVKKILLDDFNLFAIISLPAGVFANVASTGPGPKTNILFFERPGPTKQIWYYDVSQVGFSLTKAQRPIPENDLPDALQMLNNYREALREGLDIPLNEQCWIVPINNIEMRNYDLSARNPNRVNEDYTHHTPESLLANIASKHQYISELIEELQEWFQEPPVIGEINE